MNLMPASRFSYVHGAVLALLTCATAPAWADTLPSATAPATRPALTLVPDPDPAIANRGDWSVGALILDRYLDPVPTATATTTAPAISATQPAEGLTGGLGKLASTLGKMIDFDTMPVADDAQLEIFRLKLPTRKVQPYAAVGVETKDRPDDKGKLGVGAGTMLNLSRHASFGTELLVFPSDKEMPAAEGASRLGDVRVLTRLQITF